MSNISLLWHRNSFDIWQTCFNWWWHAFSWTISLIERLLVAAESRIRWTDRLCRVAVWTLHYIIWQEQSIQFSNILLSSRDELTKLVLWRVDLAEMEIEWFVWFGPFDHWLTLYTMLFWSAADSLQLGKLCWYWHTLPYTRVVDNTALFVHQATCALSLKCCLYFAGIGGNSGHIHVLIKTWLVKWVVFSLELIIVTYQL